MATLLSEGKGSVSHRHGFWAVRPSSKGILTRSNSTRCQENGLSFAAGIFRFKYTIVSNDGDVTPSIVDIMIRKSNLKVRQDHCHLAMDYHKENRGIAAGMSMFNFWAITSTHSRSH